MAERTASPLSGVRILDLSFGDAQQVARLLADLGADVILIEPPHGSPERTCPPAVEGHGLAFALRNANKRSVILDPKNPRDVERLLELAESADIVVDSGDPGQAGPFIGSTVQLADRFEHLVVMSVTDFGRTGPRSAWRATDGVLAAMSSVLSRSGPPCGAPVLPPSGIASATAAAQAAWALLVAYYHRLRTGRGDYVDFSRYEAVLQALDPPFGAQGQAAAARGLATSKRGRPTRQDSYPIFECRDGWIRICILAPRQWRAMRSWLGEPPEFQDPKYDTIGARAADFDLIGAAIAALFSQYTADELVEFGAARGVPVAAILTPAEVLSAPHFLEVSAWTSLDLEGAKALVVPNGCVVIDGHRAGLRRLAPPPGVDAPSWLPAERADADDVAVHRPLEGLRVLDLGVIVAGGELGRLFADQGAEVIKVESPTYPDGLRQARPGQTMSESFAWARRNHEALGLDLRAPAGADMFGQLVTKADAVFANFKPGTLDSLGFSYERLRVLNPRIVLTESSAYGDRGPWRSRMGYGPLVRSATGITHMWTDDDVPSEATRHQFFDAVTVFPDHLVARLAASATLAGLIQQRRTGEGIHIHISQAETAVSALESLYATAWARSTGLEVDEGQSFEGVYPCQGDDEWCVVSVRSDAEWAALVDAIGAADLATDERFATANTRLQHRRDLDLALSKMTREYAPEEISDLLQGRGVVAGPMLRATDILTDTHVKARQVYADMSHPLFDVALPSEIGPAAYRRLPQPAMRPAPLLGEHTVELCQRLLGVGDEDVDALIADGVLHVTTTTTTTTNAKGHP